MNTEASRRSAPLLSTRVRGALPRRLVCASLIMCMSLIASLGWAQVSEESIHAQAELGGGYISEGAGGYGALVLGAEVHPAYQIAARYQLEFDRVRKTINHRPLLELRYQLNVLEVIPWMSATTGVSYGAHDLAWTAGGALGADLRLNTTQFLSFATRFTHPHVWTFGVAFGGRFIVNDPFER